MRVSTFDARGIRLSVRNWSHVCALAVLGIRIIMHFVKSAGIHKRVHKFFLGLFLHNCLKLLLVSGQFSGNSFLSLLLMLDQIFLVIYAPLCFLYQLRFLPIIIQFFEYCFHLLGNNFLLFVNILLVFDSFCFLLLFSIAFLHQSICYV